MHGCIEEDLDNDIQDSLSNLVSNQDNIKEEYNIVLMLPLFLDQSYLDIENCEAKKKRPFSKNTIQRKQIFIFAF